MPAPLPFNIGGLLGGATFGGGRGTASSGPTIFNLSLPQAQSSGPTGLAKVPTGQQPRMPGANRGAAINENQFLGLVNQILNARGSREQNMAFTRDRLGSAEALRGQIDPVFDRRLAEIQADFSGSQQGAADRLSSFGIDPGSSEAQSALGAFGREQGVAEDEAARLRAQQKIGLEMGLSDAFLQASERGRGQLLQSQLQAAELLGRLGSAQSAALQEQSRINLGRSRIQAPRSYF